MTDFVLCGTGWRAQFYMRIASAFPGEFQIASVYTRRHDEMERLLSLGYFATNSLDEALSHAHDGVIVSSGREGFLPLLENLSVRGERILSETSFLSLGESELGRAEKIEGSAMEQYWHTPLYSSIRHALPKIGKVGSVYLSALHNHHAASILRGIFPSLEIKEVRRVLDSSFSSLKTGARPGLVRTGETEDYRRKITVVEFRSGEVFINDFSSTQYHSYIIPSRIEIRGERGVITEKGITYIGKDGYPVTEDFVFHRDSSKINHTTTLTHVTLGSDVVFTNGFYPSSLDDDEIAIATMLREFSEGKPGYSISEAVADARLGKLF